LGALADGFELPLGGVLIEFGQLRSEFESWSRVCCSLRRSSALLAAQKFCLVGCMDGVDGGLAGALTPDRIEERYLELDACIDGVVFALKVVEG
jgi:hypothetical protein